MAIRKSEADTVWRKIPWVELKNPYPTIAMFEVGDIIQSKWRGKTTRQVVNKMWMNETWHYCVIRKYGQDLLWVEEAELNRFSIMRKWNFDMRKKFLNPTIVDKTYSKGVSVSLLFKRNKSSQAKLYKGYIDKTWLTGNAPMLVLYYKIKFEDKTKLKINQYRMLWMLEQTSTYLESLPYAKTKPYTGDDIPLALPGLKLRF